MVLVTLDSKNKTKEDSTSPLPLVKVQQAIIVLNLPCLQDQCKCIECSHLHNERAALQFPEISPSICSQANATLLVQQIYGVWPIRHLEQMGVDSTDLPAAYNTKTPSDRTNKIIHGLLTDKEDRHESPFKLPN
jgi:hypothetical protein